MNNDWYWKIENNAQDEAEIFIYDDIADKNGWFSEKVTPKDFAAQLKTLNNKNVVLRINSYGGNVNAASAINSLLVDYKGYKTAKIDGIAASAATIIAMGADKVIMPQTALFMIHNPAIYTDNAMTEKDCKQMIDTLAVVKNSIIGAYRKKTNLSSKKLSELMDNETWMDAKTAKKYGFVDEISNESADISLNNNILVVNSCKYSINNSKIDEIKDILGGKIVDKQTELTGFINWIKELVSNSSNQNSIKPVENNNDLVDEAVAKERKRILDLTFLEEKDNPIILEMVNLAKEKGLEKTQIEPFINIVKKHSANNAGIKFMQNVIDDNLSSGVENISAGNINNNDIQKDIENNFVTGIKNAINKKKV